MTPSHIQRIIFISLSGSGIGGNFFLFIKHVYKSVMDPQKKVTDFILIQLTFTNVMILCARGISDTILVFYFNNSLSDIACKTMVYLGRVARGLSICTTCLLSMVQAATISPRNTLWRKLMPRTAWQILPYLFFFWIFNLLISSNLLYYITAVSSMNQSGVQMSVGYCNLLPSRQIVQWLFLLLMALRDTIFQSLMGWSSGCIAFDLFKHHQRVLYLYSSRSAKNSSPEIRATVSTLILTVCFLVFYWADFIFSFYIGSTLRYDSTITNIKIFLVLGYASLSPFVLITRGVHLVNCWHTHREV